MGFAGNVEPCFIIPTVVAVNESYLGQAASQKAGPGAIHSAGVMADLDFFIGEEAIARTHANSYTLSYPIRHGQVWASALLQITVCCSLYHENQAYASLGLSITLLIA